MNFVKTLAAIALLSSTAAFSQTSCDRNANMWFGCKLKVGERVCLASSDSLKNAWIQLNTGEKVRISMTVTSVEEIDERGVGFVEARVEEVLRNDGMRYDRWSAYVVGRPQRLLNTMVTSCDRV